MEKLAEFDKDFLFDLAGFEKGKVSWGAAMGASMSYLKNLGYLKQVGGTYTLTDAGREKATELWGKRNG